MASDSNTLDFPVGAFRHIIDDKNRLTIRAQWRRKGEGEIGEDFIMLPGPNLQYLLIMRPEEFKQALGEAKVSPNVSPADRRKFLRQAHARSQRASSDKQGRLVLPPEMCSLLNLKGEVMVAAGEGRLEVWNLEKWQAEYAQETPTFDRVSEAIGL